MSGKVKNIYTGQVVRFNLEQVDLPNGQTCELEIVHHPGGVAVVAINEQQQICLLRQYRHAAGGWLWEIPAGKTEANEAPEYTARRELEEESGMRAGTIRYLGKTVTSPAICTEVIQLYLAEQLTHVEVNHQVDEVIEIHWFSLAQVQQMICQGEIDDAKTLAGLYYYQLSCA